MELKYFEFKKKFTNGAICYIIKFFKATQWISVTRIPTLVFISEQNFKLPRLYET